MRGFLKLLVLFLLSAAQVQAASVAICRVPVYEGVCCSHFSSDYDFGNGMCCGGMPYTNTNICPGRDSTPPNTTLNALAPDPTNDNTPTFTGTAVDALSSISSVEYRVDGGAWASAGATDGAFDGLSEGFSFTTPPLADGSHTVETRAKDAAGNWETSFASDAFVVDTLSPAISNVSSTTPNGAYNASKTIRVTANFSETVFVSGTPRIQLETGAVDQYAVYASGSGTSLLTFNYIVQQGDVSGDLDYTGAGSLGLNGGSIRDAAGNNAALALPLPGAAGSLGANKNLVVDTTPPVTTDNSDSSWHNANVLVTLSCTDATSGCLKIEYCLYPSAGPVCTSYTNGNIISLACAQNANCEYNISYRSTDNAGNTEGLRRPAYTLKIDKSIPNVTSPYASPDPFSPNGDGVADTTRFYYNTSDNTSINGGGAHFVNTTIYDDSPGIISLYGAPRKVRRIVNEYKALGLNYTVWDGRDDSGNVVGDGSYLYNISVVDRAGNPVSRTGRVTVDDSPPDIAEVSPIPAAVEPGTALNFSAVVFDASNVTVSVCPSSAPCYGSPGAYCSMNRTAERRYNCAYNTSKAELRTHIFYVVASDLQNLSSSVPLQSTVMLVSVFVDGVEPQPADLQGSVKIRTNYSTNHSGSVMAISGACIVSGDVSGVMAYSNGQYSADFLPSRLESNRFTVTCSNASYPTKSVSGSFIARDLAVLLDFEFDPLYVGGRNRLYADVYTVNNYYQVESAEIKKFSVSGNGFFVSGDFLRNASTGRWEANFTPPSNGTYFAQAYFKNGSLNGSSLADVAAGGSLRVSTDVGSNVLDVDLGSSALASVFIENRRKRGVLYNITIKGRNLQPVSFDGDALSFNTYSTLAFVPPKNTQSHPLLVKGLQTSPYEKEISITVREVDIPNEAAAATVKYKVSTRQESRRFAPDLSFLSVLVLAGASLLFAQGKGFLIQSRSE